MVLPDHALEALALGDADDVDQLALVKGCYGHHGARLDGGRLGQPHFAQHPRGFGEAGLLGVIERGLARVFDLLPGEAELHGIVAVALDGLHLHDGAGAGFDHGDGHERVFRIVDLRHPDLLA